jgi:hypothetical protein
LKAKLTQEDYAIRAAKTTEDALGNFMKLSSLFDESNYHEHAITQQSTKTTPTIVIKTTTRAKPKNQSIKYTTAANTTKIKRKKPEPQNNRYKRAKVKW